MAKSTPKPPATRWYAPSEAELTSARKAIRAKLASARRSGMDTEALESELLWQVPEIARAGGLAALRKLGKPADVMREAKMRLFGV